MSTTQAAAKSSMDLFDFMQWAKQIQTIDGVLILDPEMRNKILSASTLIQDVLTENNRLRQELTKQMREKIIESRNHSPKLAIAITKCLQVLRESGAGPDDWIAQLPTGINSIAQLDEDQARKYILNLRALDLKFKQSLDSDKDQA